MKRTLIFILALLLIVTSAFSWSGHSAYTYYLIQELPVKDKLVSITEYSYKEDREYNLEYLILEDVAGKRKFIDVPYGMEIPPDPPPVNNQLPVWQILSIYAPEPDFGMDEGLKLHPLQGLIGNSQGVRHMRYKIGVLKAFEADKSFLYFADLSKQAFENGDEYWGYRFLARALHYIEDLSQPYHNSPGTFFEMIGAAFSKNKANKLNNAHYLMDDYLIYLLFYSDDASKEIIMGAQPIFFESYEDYVKEVMKYTLDKFPIIHKEIKNVFGEKLERPLTLVDIENADKTGKLAKIKAETLSILSYSSSVIKGFLLDFLTSVGEI